MINYFIPADKGKIKTNIRGYWLDKNKLYYDYMDFIQGDYINAKLNAKEFKILYNQKAIAYIENNMLKIYYDDNHIEILSNRIYKEVLKENLKLEIKNACKTCGGCTVYIIDSKYFLEVFYR